MLHLPLITKDTSLQKRPFRLFQRDFYHGESDGSIDRTHPESDFGNETRRKER